MKDRRLQNGYSNLGPIQIPPHAQAFVLTDRADGTKYLVSHNMDSFGVLRLSLNTNYASIQKKEGVQIYDANEGPKIDTDGQFTLIVRGGRIGFEYTPFPNAVTDLDQYPAYTRVNSGQKKILVRDTIPYPLLSHIGIDSNG